MSRIPLHAHSNLNDGGDLAAVAVTRITGAGTSTEGGTTTAAIAVQEDGSTVLAAAGIVNAGHGLDVTDQGAGIAGLAVDETELTVERSIEGGQSVINAHGSMGATETIDPTDGNVHTGTLDADCTFTLSAPSGSGAALLELQIAQDGTGGWDITWPGSVTWAGGTAPVPDTTAGTTTIYLIETTDGGTNWVGVMVGGGGASLDTPALTLGTTNATGAATTAIGTDATIAIFDATAPVTQAFGDSASHGSVGFAADAGHRHGMPASPAGGGVGEILISDTPSTPLVFADLIQNEAQDDLVYADP